MKSLDFVCFFVYTVLYQVAIKGFEIIVAEVFARSVNDEAIQSIAVFWIASLRSQRHINTQLKAN